VCRKLFPALSGGSNLSEEKENKCDE